MEQEQIHERFMREAIKQAKKAEDLDEVPIGCVIVHEGKIIARGYNKRNTMKSTLAHAELLPFERHVRNWVTGEWKNVPCILR